jgi:hypothetical protein
MVEQSRYAELTANERLEVAGLRAEFDAAANARSRSEMIRILAQVDVENADWLADMIIANPRRYGY